MRLEHLLMKHLVLSRREMKKLIKIQIFHESLILAQDERWRRA